MRTPRILTIALVVLGAAFASNPLAAQWVNYPTAEVPRKADGKVDMAARTPRLTDGKPDLSGVWTSEELGIRTLRLP